MMFKGGRIVDTLIGFREVDPHPKMPGLRPEYKEGVHPHAYMFNDIPEELAPDADPAISIDETLRKMDQFGIEWGVVSMTARATPEALRRHPDRFIGTLGVDGNNGMDAVRAIVAAHEEHGIRGVTIFPAGSFPPIAINHKLWYPIYAKCVELDLPVFIAVGVPGPRLKMMPQYVGWLDEVCFDFPELKIIMRHGGEPWADLAVKLMLKWPNLYYSTSGFAPKYIPQEIIDYANSRGAGKVLHAGYFPFGIELERTFAELEKVPFKDAVWPQYLGGTARKLFKLPE
ncbi:amidohydrolase family protein [Novosphingobium bradum]|uniref:Amidohydrolase family protein n=1 Tax=Novosphingobium bradum TaxID=1737444 RepID=A0ABV7IJ60_9SPHN